MFGQFAATAVMVAPAALVVDRSWLLPPPSAVVWAAMAGLVLLSTALAYAIFFRLLGSAGTTNISLVTLLIPVSATFLETLVLGERLSALQCVGMVLIGFGLVAIDGRAWTALHSTAVQRTRK